MLWLLSACWAPGPSLEPVSWNDAALPWVEQYVGGASAEHGPLPLVVTLHGRGSTPERFRSFFEDLTEPLRIVHLEAPVSEHDGRAWFTFRGKATEALHAEIDGLADRAERTVRDVLAARSTEGKPVVMGFSQGSMVVYAMVLRHPARFAKAIPVSGVLLSSMPPSVDAAEMPPIVAMHGERDPIIGPAASARAVAELTSRGMPAELRLFPEAVHWIDGDLQQALFEELAEVR